MLADTLTSVYIYIFVWSVKPKDCKDYQLLGKNTSGEYNIYLPDSKGGDKIKVYCDMEADGGGWTVSFNIHWQLISGL